MTRPCDVCMLVDGDQTPKQVAYCGGCKAHMCDACRANIPKRAAAWAVRGLRRGLGLDKTHNGQGG